MEFLHDSETTADLLKIFKKIGTVTKTTISDKDVDDIFRFGKDKKVIRVEFVSKLKKKELVAAVKSKEIKGTDIGLTVNSQIFVNEHLSPANHKLYVEAKKLKKEKVFEFVWISNGQVLVRTAEGEPAVVLKSCVDLLKFMPDK